MKSIVLLAAPAAGKGSQAQMLKLEYNIPHISTGDLLREEISSGSSIGDDLKETMSLGKLVSDDIIISLLKKRISKNDCENGYILDGFPRNLSQAKAYDEMLKEMSKEIGYVFLLEVDKEIAIKRILGRISCPKCSLVYNEFIDESKPKVNGLCDSCDSKLIKRIDDNEETFNRRFETYLNETKPLIDYYEKKELLYHIDSNHNKEYTNKQIKEILEGVL